MLLNDCFIHQMFVAHVVVVIQIKTHSEIFLNVFLFE